MFFFKKYDSESDEKLMVLVAASGDERAFTELYRRYAQRLYRFFLRMLWGDNARAEDFCQEFFLKIIEKPKSFDPARSFSTWAFSVAANMCKNEYRRRQVIQIGHFPKIGVEGAYEFCPEALDQPLYEQRLQRAIDQLDLPHRQCFVLRYQEELSLKQVSEILDCPEGTVKSRTHHAVIKITKTLENWKSHA
jgi:RNA polymerase sigma-70 factor, ECF subfamily